jgi:hypothetical protein
VGGGPGGRDLSPRAHDGPAHGIPTLQEEPRMIIVLVVAIVLFVFWVLGLTTRFIAGGLIHIALVIAVILLIIYLLRVVARVI